MAAQFSIVVGADLDAAVKNINDFIKSTKNGFGSLDAAVIASVNEFKKLQSELSRSKDPAAISAIQDRLKQLAATLSSQIPPAAAKSAAALNNVNKAVANANPTLTNFGRVIQDAPFGILGIANNIDPLISSFQSLQDSTGSTGEALKSLFSALAGPAGIAIGVSAVTSALIAFGPQISAAIAGVDEFGMAQREAAGEGAEAFSKAFSEFTRLSGIINDSNAGVKRQEDAFKQLNSELAKYGLEIESITAFQKIGIEVGGLYAKIKQEEAKSSLFAAAAAEEYKQQILLQKKAQQGDLLGAFGDLKFADQLKVGAKTLTATTLAFVGGIGALKTVFETSVAKGVGGTVKALAESEKDFNNEAAKSEKEITNLVNQLDKLDGVNEKTAKTTAKAAAAASLRTAATKELTAATTELKAVTVEKLEFFPIGSIAQLNKEIQALRGQQELTFDPAVFQNYQNEIDAIALKIKEIQGGIVLPSIDSEAAGLTNFNATMNAIVAKVDTTKTATQQAVASINSALESIAVNSVVGFAETLGTALGSGDITGGIRRFAGVIGQAVTSLGVQVVAVSKAMVALQAALSSGIFAGPLGLAAGIGLIVAGAALSSLANGGLKLARGGVVASPTPALIGDGGPEAVIPLSQLANIIGGVAMQMGGGSGGGLSIVRGQDIYYSNNNASRSFGRLFG